MNCHLLETRYIVIVQAYWLGSDKSVRIKQMSIFSSNVNVHIIRCNLCNSYLISDTKKECGPIKWIVHYILYIGKHILMRGSEQTFITAVVWCAKRRDKSKECEYIWPIFRLELRMIWTQMWDTTVESQTPSFFLLLSFPKRLIYSWDYNAD